MNSQTTSINPKELQGLVEAGAVKLFALNLKSVAKRERNIGNRELAEIIDESAITLESLAAENERLIGRIEATRKVIDEGYPGQPTGREQCPHGRFSWEDCMTCYDEALLEALSGGSEG